MYVLLAAASAKRQLGLAWSAERQLPPAAQRFADFVIRQTYEDK